MDQKAAAKIVIDTATQTTIRAIHKRENENKMAIHVKALADTAATLRKAESDKAAL